MPRPANTNPVRPRETARVNPRLDKNLVIYMVAGAAGVGMLAVPAAQAKVVYTPDNQEIPPNVGLSLDLNHDGIVDFVFSNFYSSTSSILNLSVGPVNRSNEIFSTGRDTLSVFAAALPAGVEIGPNARFRKRNGAGMANVEDIKGTCQGPWNRAHEQYLGLKFIIKGGIHFGWARLNVNCVSPPPAHPISAIVTGYAYETVANRPIVAGETKGLEVSGDPGTLGNLARGTAAANSHNAQIADENH
jgi:hypothetical protein